MKHDDSKLTTLTPTVKIDRYKIFLALFSGILLFLSFPKYGLGFIAWIAFVPLFMSLRDVTSIRRAFFLGWIAGLTGCIGILYWITYVVVNYGHLPLYLGLTLMLLLACYLSVYFALFSAGIVYLRSRVPLYLAAPVLWVCLEYLKSKLFTGFPWENLGYSQFNNIFFIQMADLAGVFGLSFLIILLNTAVFAVLTERSKKAFILAGVVSLMWAGSYTYGIVRLNQVEAALKSGQDIPVSLIQGNIDQAVKWNDNYQKETIDIYEELSLRDTHGQGGLMIWPETAVPFNFQMESDLKQRVENLSVKTGKWLVFGTVSFAGSAKNADYFNSAYLLSPAGDIRGKYDKVHLVPYGEYVPLRTVFPFVSSLAAGIGDFGEGAGFYPLSMGEKKIGVLICYEAILPEAGRTYKNSGASLLVNITNDAWFGKTSAPYQHLSMALFRAVETRLYLVRAANTGISAIIDPTGKILARTDLFKKDAIHGKVKFIQLPTVYARFGDWLVGLSFMVLAFFFLWRLRGRVKHVR